MRHQRKPNTNPKNGHNRKGITATFNTSNNNSQIIYDTEWGTIIKFNRTTRKEKLEQGRPHRNQTQDKKPITGKEGQKRVP